MRLYVLLLPLLLAIGSVNVPAQQITKELFDTNGTKRAFYLFVPEKLGSNASVPLIMLLHGSGRNGLSLVEKWKDLAKKENIILVGPDAIDSRGWKIPEDGPDAVHDLIEMLKAKYPINARRVYLFGHSAGAGQALYLSLLESQYFAGTAVHAGALDSRADSFIDRAKRKIPIAIFVGTNDHLFPVSIVRATRDAFNSRGFSLELTEIKNHTHWYYDRAPAINRDAWEFLKKYELAAAPIYERYDFNR